MTLPKDPAILLSCVNTKLRDEYPSLSELCAALDADRAELESTLAGGTSETEPMWALGITRKWVGA